MVVDVGQGVGGREERDREIDVQSRETKEERSAVLTPVSV